MKQIKEDSDIFRKLKADMTKQVLQLKSQVGVVWAFGGCSYVGVWVFIFCVFFCGFWCMFLLVFVYVFVDFCVYFCGFVRVGVCLCLFFPSHR